nr:tRNA(His) guanylyltransferase 1-like isoform X1 [Tanacetum cinerariifolium]
MMHRKFEDQEFPNIILAYGFGDEYRFIFKKDTNHYSRRANWLKVGNHNKKHVDLGGIRRRQRKASKN